MAAQMLSGKGFAAVYNLAGGFKAWTGGAAIGDETLGLEHFSGNESPENTLAVAYALEQGLHDFYLSMVPKIKNVDARDLFKKLAAIELKHQDRILKAYNHIAGTSAHPEDFEKNTVTGIVEGGLTGEEYGNMFHPDWESVKDIIAIAMSIEAQALDLYQRAADKSGNMQGREMLIRIADEERIHLGLLGQLMERL